MKVGDKIIINKRSVVNPKNGKAELRAAKKVTQTVVRVYMHGAVMTNTGDVWMPVKTREGWVGGY